MVVTVTDLKRHMCWSMAEYAKHRHFFNDKLNFLQLKLFILSDNSYSQVIFKFRVTSGWECTHRGDSNVYRQYTIFIITNGDNNWDSFFFRNTLLVTSKTARNSDMTIILRGNASCVYAWIIYI